MGLLGFVQAQQQQQMFQQALGATQGLSDAEIANLQGKSEASLKQNLSSRGLLDSGLLAGGQATIAKELALAKASSKLPAQGSYINALMSKSNQPTLISSLIPLIMQHGLQGFGGNWLVPKPPVTVSP